MSRESSQRTFTVGLILSYESEEGNHSQASVLDLLELELLEVTLGHTHGVEGTTGVDALLGISSTAEELNTSHGNELNSEESSEVEGNLSAKVRGVSTLDKRKGCRVPVSLAEYLSAEGTGNSEHSPATVDDLRLGVAGQVSGLGGEVQGVL